MMTLEESEKLLEELRKRPPADWMKEMLVYYRRTGGFRAQDLRRLLGSQQDNDALRRAVLDIIRAKNGQ